MVNGLCQACGDSNVQNRAHILVELRLLKRYSWVDFYGMIKMFTSKIPSMLFDMFLQFKDFTWGYVFQSCFLAKCLGASLILGFSVCREATGRSSGWFLKKSCAAKPPVLWIPGETNEVLKNLQCLFLQMISGWLKSYWNCGVPAQPVAVLTAGPYGKIIYLLALEKNPWSIS